MNKLKNSSSLHNIFLFILILFSVAITFYSGYRGVFPLDSFLIFDGGYKILNGFHPFKNYWSITGPFLDYVQSSLFFLFGVNWNSYILHSALINVLLSTISFYFFIKLGLNIFFSFTYALSIALLAYPSVGSPFMDHHAAIFSLISLIFLILAIKKDNKFFWFLVPLTLSISFLSKQIPSAYLLVLFILFIILDLKIKSKKNYTSIKYLLLGSIFSLFIFSFILMINKISIDDFLIQYILYPLSIGAERSSNLTLDFKNSIAQFKFIYFSLIPLIFFLYLNIRQEIKKKNKVDILIISLVFFSILIFIYVQLLTKNQVLIFFLIPFCLGLTHLFVKNYSKKDVFTFLLIFLLTISNVKYHLRYNVEKKFMELSNVDFNLSKNAEILDKRLKNLKWISPNYNKLPSDELELLIDSKEKILNSKEKKIIISDYQILPAITENKNFAPNKWFDNLSVPKNNNPYFMKYQDFFLKNMINQDIKKIYIVGEKKEKYIEFFLSKNGCYNKNNLNKIMIEIELKIC